RRKIEGITGRACQPCDVYLANAPARSRPSGCVIGSNVARVPYNQMHGSKSRCNSYQCCPCLAASQVSRGQFLSEHPTFLAIGAPAKLRALSQDDQQQFLSDPQQLNSYNYARGNPIMYSDKTGNSALSEISDVLEIASYLKLTSDVSNSGYLGTPLNPDQQA